jgi:HK97 family phage portal protein
MGIVGEPLYLIQDRNASEMNQHYLPAANVFHLKALASVNQFLGDSPVSRASRAISLAHAAERYAINYYGSNATVGGVLELPRTFKDEVEEKNFKEKFNASRSGVGQAFGTLFVGPGTKYTTVGHNAEESQVVQSRNFSVEDIIRYFGVPPHLVGVSISSQGYGRNLAELGMTFTRHTLAPWTKRFSQEADYKLFAQRAPWKFTEIDTSWLTHGDALARAQAMEVLRRNGVITANEWRDAEGMNDIGDPGELFLVTNNLTIMEEENLEVVKDTPEEKMADEGDTLAADEGSQEPGESDEVEDEAEAPEMSGATAAYAVILASHQKRLNARFADLQKKLKNGVLQEKMEGAVEWSRTLTSQQLQTAGLNPPPNWMLALQSAEKGGDIKEIAKGLEGFKQ